MVNRIGMFAGAFLSMGISGTIYANAATLCTLCTRVVVMDSKKAACFSQQYDAAKKWFAAESETTAAIRLKGCIPGLKLSFRGVQESFRVGDTKDGSSDPDAKINVTEAGLDCLKSKIDALGPDKLNPETLFDMKKVCS